MEKQIYGRALVFVGIKHCGKSTQGKRIASHLGLEFFDTDDLILKHEGISPREIYAKFGKEKFMEAEKNACQKLAEFFESQKQKSLKKNCDNAAQFKPREKQNALEILKSFGTIIFLQAEEKTAADRIVREADFSMNPVLNLPAYIADKKPRTEKEAREIFHDFFTRRNNRYKEIADVVVQMQDASKEANTEKILSALF